MTKSRGHAQMGKQMRLLVILFFPVLLCSCRWNPFADKDPGYHSSTYTSENLPRSPEDFLIPGKLWDQLAKIRAPGAEKDPPRDREVEFVAARIFLVEKTPGVLAAPAMQFETDEGGGEFDFANWRGSHNGSFYLGVEVKDEVPEGALKAYFLSQAPEIKKGGLLFGSGCDSFYDVTSFFTKSMRGKGFFLNTSDFRHAYALGGTLFLAYVKASALRLARVTFKDSGMLKARGSNGHTVPECPVRQEKH